MKITALSVAALFVAPALAAKTWDVNIVNGLISPQELSIAPGDSVRWPNNDGGDHAIVQTNAGARNCTNLVRGFNSGRLAKNQSYQRAFPTAGVFNYKDGIGANCVKGAVGTITVKASGVRATSTTSHTATATTSVSAAPITSPTGSPNVASYMTPESSVFLGVAAFIGALVL